MRSPGTGFPWLIPVIQLKNPKQRGQSVFIRSSWDDFYLFFIFKYVVARNLKIQECPICGPYSVKYTPK